MEFFNMNHAQALTQAIKENPLLDSFSLLNRADDILSSFQSNKNRMKDLRVDSVWGTRIGEGRKDDNFISLPATIRSLITSDIVEFLGLSAIENLSTSEVMVAVMVYNKVRERIRAASRGF